MPNTKNVVFYHFLHSRDEEDEFKRLNKEPNPHDGWEVAEVRDEPLEELQLFPWEIRKALTADDLQFIPGLELSREQVQDHIFKHLNAESVTNMLLHKERIPIEIRDVDTQSDHHYVSLGKCSNSDNFCLQGGWYKNFVYRRGLKAGMQIGMYWGTRTSTLCFSVLNDIPKSSRVISKDALEGVQNEESSPYCMLCSRALGKDVKEKNVFGKVTDANYILGLYFCSNCIAN